MLLFKGLKAPKAIHVVLIVCALAYKVDVFLTNRCIKNKLWKLEYTIFLQNILKAFVRFALTYWWSRKRSIFVLTKHEIPTKVCRITYRTILVSWVQKLEKIKHFPKTTLDYVVILCLDHAGLVRYVCICIACPFFTISNGTIFHILFA